MKFYNKNHRHVLVVLFVQRSKFFFFVFFLIAMISINPLSAQKINNQFSDVINIGSQRELFVDDFLVERLVGKAELRLHHPNPQNIVLETNEGWEGNGTNYVTVFQDGNKYRMYYRAAHYSYLEGKDRPTHQNLYCYAESSDGIHWIKPDLGLFDWNGSKKNNIIMDEDMENFSPFLDTNPQCSADAKYKALGVNLGKKRGLYAYKSTDGLRWKLMDTLPVITKGAFDSQNLAFWDSYRGEYRGYHRDFRGQEGKVVDLINSGIGKGRDVRTETSIDFLRWTEPVFLDYSANVDLRNHSVASDNMKILGKEYPSGRVSELYTNQILPYYRAPHLLIGFPTRYIDRGWTESAKALPRYDYRQVRAKDSRREGTAVTEGMIISSRDRKHFSVWPEAFLRPGLRNRDTWFYGDMYQNWGIVETKSAIEDAPPELSIYASERTLQEKGAILRRYSLRIDGFVSLHAPLIGGELVTKPITFAGNQLLVNVSTSAAGSVRVEVQDVNGQPLPGFSLADCHEIYGDDLKRTVSWKGSPDLGYHAGKPIRLRFVIKDADVYSFIFQERTQ